MKSVKDTLLQRRSVRRYEREHISQDDMLFIYEAIRNTPTSYNGQQFSVIDVTDPDLKLQIEQMTGQKQIKTCDHFLVFCADYHKIRLLAEKKEIEMPDFEQTVDGLTVAVIDATLAMMSAVAAAESLGLGTCCIGYARTAAPEALARLLKLPRNVFVVCGLAIGVPREEPDLKPKQPRELVIMQDSYGDDEAMTALLEEYDAEVARFNRTRSGARTDNDWCGHVVGYYREAMSYRMLDALQRRGFGVNH